MAPAPRLDQRPRQALGVAQSLNQSLVMTPQLQQAIKLLALSNLEIETFIGEALEANPLLDVATSSAASDDTPTASDVAAPGGGHDEPDNIAFAAGGTGAIGGGGAAGDGGEYPGIEDRGAAPPTLVQHLLWQIGAIVRDPQTGAIARHLVGMLDEAGYFTAPPLCEIAAALAVAPVHVERALALVQSLDPTGVGARSLGECIAIQAREVDRLDPAMAILLDNLDLVARGEFARLRRLCEVDEDDLGEMLRELRGYDPKPGLRCGGADPLAVIPAILATRARDARGGADGWRIAINRATLPRLVVNRTYYTELRGTCTDRATRGWLSERLADANWLVKALDQRQRTILKVATEIVRHQTGFFDHGVARLRPLTLRAVADAIGMHESTVSRVTSNKYLTCPRGTFELKYFFSSGVGAVSDSGLSGSGGGASAEAVKAAIRSLIDAECAGAVLSDDALVDLLRARGFDLARRTVAKYREAIGLGSSVQRRRMKVLAGMR